MATDSAHRQPPANPLDTLRQLAVIAATLATLVLNGLANALPLNGQGTGEISNQFDSLFTPAGYVFSIWGLIYLGLTAFTIWQALPAQRANPRCRRIGWLYVASALANVAWLFAWHWLEFAASLVAMLAILASLLVIWLRLKPSRGLVSRAELWTTHLPFSLYLGWITVATVANTAILLLHWQWDGGPLSPVAWTLVMLAVAAVLGLLFALRERDFTCTGVLVWALAGIAVKQEVAAVEWTAAALALLLVVAGVVSATRSRA
jgi:benzodiazapine receptor